MNSKKQLEVRATKTFARNLKSFLKKRHGLEKHVFDKALEIAGNPEMGRRIPGRKDLLWKARLSDPISGKGKSGGFRMIYAWKDGWSFIILCMIYPKSEKPDATHGELERVIQEIELDLRQSP